VSAVFVTVKVAAPTLASVSQRTEQKLKRILPENLIKMPPLILNGKEMWFASVDCKRQPRRKQYSGKTKKVGAGLVPAQSVRMDAEKISRE
jgi:hypothetical protein